MAIAHPHTNTQRWIADVDCLLISDLVHHLIDNKATLEEPQLSQI